MNMKAPLLAAAFSLLVFAPAHAQDLTGVDPACIVKDAAGKDSIDMVKCPDGKMPAAASSSGTATPSDSTVMTAPSATPSATWMVPGDAFADAKVMTGSDFIGKRVYTRAGEDIGEVNDIILSTDGKINAAILGVGGFLGIGEKNVAVAMNAIEMVPDGSAVKLVVDATKDQLTSAGTYDAKTRSYVK